MTSLARAPSALLALFVLAASASAADPAEIRAGSELDFRPYCFTDEDGQPTGFGVELLQAVADKMGLRLQITPAPWDKVWSGLVAGDLDVLPVVARTPGREPLVDFSLPHTETFDAFFVREGRPPIPDIAAAAGLEIVVLRSDAAHHQLLERNFSGKVIPVESIADGLRLIAAGRHDAFLCSRLIGVLEREQAGVKGVKGGPVIPEYKRVFSFAVRKGNPELVEKLNQGLLIVKADGTYNEIYRRWLTVEDPWRTWLPYFQWAVAALIVLAGLVVVLQWLVRRRTHELARANEAVEAELAKRRQAEEALRQLNATLEQRIADRTGELTAANAQLNRSRQAALNLARDATAARAATEQANAKLLQEIGTRKQAEAAVREERDRLTALVSSIQDEVWFVDAAGQFTLVNPSASREFTLEPEATADVRQLAANLEVLRPDGTPRPIEEAPPLRALCGEVVTNQEEWIRTPATGESRYRQVSAAPVRDHNGRILGSVSVVRDITERKAAEAALQASEARFKMICEYAPVMLDAFDDHGRCVLWNKEAERTFGWTLEELNAHGNPLALFYPDPEIRKAVIETVTSKPEKIFREWRPRAKDGSERNCLWANFRLPDGVVINVGYDITERKRAEAALREQQRLHKSVTDNTTLGLFIMDNRQQCVFMNPAAVQLTGFTLDEVQGRPLHDVIHHTRPDGSHYPLSECAIDQAFPKNDREQGEEVFVHRDGHFYPVAFTASPLRDDSGRPFGTIIEVEDITERKRAEEELKASLAEKEVLLKEVHHRVKNNMQVISSLVNLQADQLKDDAMRAVLQDVTHRVRSMAMIHEKLYQSADLARVEFAEYARSLLNYLWRAHGAAAARIRLTLDLEPVPLSVNAAVPCGLILNELASNALKHAFRGKDADTRRRGDAEKGERERGDGWEVGVSLRADSEGRVCLRVRDNGAGLPAGLDWRRADSLGLRLVQILAKQLGASVEVRSGEGTEFVVTF